MELISKRRRTLAAFSFMWRLYEINFPQTSSENFCNTTVTLLKKPPCGKRNKAAPKNGVALCFIRDANGNQFPTLLYFRPFFHLAKTTACAAYCILDFAEYRYSGIVLNKNRWLKVSSYEAIMVMYSINKNLSKECDCMDLRIAKTICFIIVGIITILLSAMGITTNPVFGYLAIAAVVIYFIFHHTFWRCSKCGKNLGPLWVKCCPNCGEKIN